MDSVGNYINKSKNNLSNIVKCLEKNIEYLDNDLWASLEESNELIDSVINIYYDKYFLNINNDFDKISNYININNKINFKLKIILLSIIDYYESIDNVKVLNEKEGSILYLNILIYLGLQIYNTNFNLIDEPKKIEKFINNIIDNFAKIRFSFPIKIKISTTLLTSQLIIYHICRFRHFRYQCVTDKGNTHSRTSNIIRCHLLIKFKYYIRYKAILFAQFHCSNTRVILWL